MPRRRRDGSSVRRPASVVDIKESSIIDLLARRPASRRAGRPAAPGGRGSSSKLRPGRRPVPASEDDGCAVDEGGEVAGDSRAQAAAPGGPCMTSLLAEQQLARPPAGSPVPRPGRNSADAQRLRYSADLAGSSASCSASQVADPPTPRISRDRALRGDRQASSRNIAGPRTGPAVAKYATVSWPDSRESRRTGPPRIGSRTRPASSPLIGIPVDVEEPRRGGRVRADLQRRRPSTRFVVADPHVVGDDVQDPAHPVPSAGLIDAGAACVRFRRRSRG